MSKVPSESLINAARALAVDFNAMIDRPDWESCAKDPADWRSYVSRSMRKLWGQLDYGERLAAYVTAASIAASKKRSG